MYNKNELETKTKQSNNYYIHQNSKPFKFVSKSECLDENIKIDDFDHIEKQKVDENNSQVKDRNDKEPYDAYKVGFVDMNKDIHDKPKSSLIPNSEKEHVSISLVIMLSLCIFLCYADRTIMPSSIIDISKQFSFNKYQQGIILSCFFGGYIWTQILGGYLSDTTRLGGKGILFCGVLIWSLSMILTCINTNFSYYGFIICRVMLGFGEGVSFPAVSGIIGNYIPKNKTSSILSIILSFSYIGAAFAAFLTPPAIVVFNWKFSFYLFGSLGIVWILVWIFYDVNKLNWSYKLSIMQYRKKEWESRCSANSKRTSTIVSTDHVFTEIDKSNHFCKTQNESSDNISNIKHLEKMTNTEYEDQIIRLSILKALSLFKYKSIWAVVVGHFFHAWSQMGFVTWLPVYFVDVNLVETKNLGFYTSPSWILQSFAIVVFGYLADYLIKKDNRKKNVRIIFQSISMIFPAMMYLILILINKLNNNNAVLSTVIVSIAYAIGTMSCGGVTVNQYDIAPNFPAVVYAIGNTFGTISGLLSIFITGIVLNKSDGDFLNRKLNEETNRSELLYKWNIVLTMYIIFNICGAILFFFLVDDNPIDIRKEPKAVNNTE